MSITDIVNIHHFLYSVAESVDIFKKLIKLFV